MDTQRSTSAFALRRPSIRTVATIAVVLIVLGVAFAGIAKATDQPSFCGGACHEMDPFHSAWTQGAHKNISCIECHVDPGTIARMEHKVVALKEVASHIKGGYSFPNSEAVSVPSERCVRCHNDIKVTSTGFSHAEHAKRGECVMCHSTVGHNVSVAALKEAGVYTASTKAAFDTTKTAVVDGGKANLPGHITVPCSRCHDMSATKCSQCHKPKHVDRGPDCTVCHATGPKFVFVHPVRTDCGTCHKPKNAKHTWKGACTDCHKDAPGASFKATHTGSTACESCHKRPDKHRSGDCSKCHKNVGANWAFAHPSSGDCSGCHSRPAKHKSGSCAGCHQNAGSNWAYAHPGSGANCTSCHSAPSGHRSGSCASCHSHVGKSWSFSHPGSGSSCASCHSRPSGHRNGSCTKCHRVGKSWKFSHPGNGSSCSSCHQRPGGHRGGQCSSCHSTGSKWAFRHSGSSSCGSCHNPPSNHYGNTCKSCHSPSRPWSSATFSHPRVPGGEHSSRSFACTKCHPGSGKGPGHYCSCHGNTTGPGDD